MLEVRPSKLKNAGDGLFAMKNIAKNTIMRVDQSRLRSQDTSCAHEVIDCYVASNMCAQSACVIDGKISKLKNVRNVASSSKNKQYVHIPKCEYLMKANDLAWRPDIDEGAYDENSGINALSLVMEFDLKSRILGVVGLFNRSVNKGEEIGITYGYSYWV